jgi:hypothetical protein
LAILGQKTLDRLKNTIPVQIKNTPPFYLKMTKGKTKYEKKHNKITPPYCPSKTRVNRVNKNPRVIKCLQIIQNKIINCLKINTQNTK